MSPGDLNVEITCIEEIGEWQADIFTDGEHEIVFTSDGAEYLDTLPVEYDNTIIWISDNQTYPGYFYIGYTIDDMDRIDTSYCGQPIVAPTTYPEGIPALVTPPPLPQTYTVGGGETAGVLPSLLMFVVFIALVMRIAGRKV